MNEASRLRRSLFGLHGIILAIMVTAVAVGVAVPLYRNLSTEVVKEFFSSIERQSIAASQWAMRAKDLARQITSRTRIRQELQKYNQRKISLAQLVDFTAPKLEDAMRLSEEVAGITRLDVLGETIVSLGVKPPALAATLEPSRKKDVLLGQTFEHQGKKYLWVRAPIKDRLGNFVGADIISVSTTELTNIVQGATNAHESQARSAGFLVYPLADKFQSVISPPVHQEKSKEAYLKSGVLEAAYQAHSEGRSGWFQHDGLLGVAIPVKDTPWLIVACHDENTLRAPIIAELTNVLLVALAAFVICLIGYWIALRPLSRRILLKQSELEDEIKDKTASLQQELAARKLTEEEVREKELLLRKIAENYPNSYLNIIESDLTVSFAAGSELYKQGLDPNQFVGMRLEQVYGGLTEEVKEHFLKTFSGKEQTFQIFLNNQHLVYRTVPLYDHDGSVKRILSVAENVTQRVEAERELKVQHAYMNLLFEVSPAAVAILNSDHQIVRVNQEFTAMFGYTQKESAGQLIHDLLVPAEIREEAMNQGLRASRGEIVSFEAPRNTKDGTRITTSIIARQILADGQDVGAYVLYRNITERKLAEAKLTEALEDARLRQKEVSALLEAAQAIPAHRTFEAAARQVFDICKRFTGAGSGYFALLAPYCDENGLRFFDADGPHCTVYPKLPMPNKGLWEVAYGTKDVVYDNNFTNSRWIEFVPGGLPEWKNVLVAPLIVEDKAVGHIGLANKPGGFTKRDAKISKAFGDLAAVALNYINYQEKQRKSKERLQVIFDNTPAAMLLVNENRTILQMNKTGLIAVGKDKAEGWDGQTETCVNNSCFSQESTGCGFGENCNECEILEIVKSTFETNQNHNKIEASLRLKSQNGPEERSALISTSIINSNPPRTALVVIDDITDFRKVEQAKSEIEAQLRQAQKMEALGTLAGGIAHDFNNILSAIIGYSELGLEDAEAGIANPYALKEILQAGDRAKDLVTQILTFSRKLEPELRPVNLNQVIKQTERMLERTIPKMVGIELFLEDDLWTANADFNQMSQVLLNLCANSSDAMPDGGRLVLETQNITLDEDYSQQRLEAAPGEYILLSVSDTGQGIDKKTMDHIFDPFFTQKDVGRGTGLGLATVYGIIKSHKGHITCHSEVGRGSTFKIYLPAVHFEGGSLSSNKADEENINGGNENIMLVDDDEAIRDLGRELLIRHGYRVLTADTGESALELYKEFGSDIDLLVLDISMPGMGGQKCLEKLQAINPEIKVVISSGYSRYGPLKDALVKGATAFVPKPFNKTEMLKTVRDMLDA